MFTKRSWEAIKNLDKMKQGCVEIKIQPPMGGIKQMIETILFALEKKRHELRRINKNS